MSGTFLRYPISTSRPREFRPSVSATSSVPSLSTTRPRNNGSTPSNSTGDDDSSSEHSWDVWDIVDSVYTRRSDDPHAKLLSMEMSRELDGETFGADRNDFDRSTNRKPLEFPRPPEGGQIEIPHFPALTEALLGSPDKSKAPVRTSGESQSKDLIRY